MPSGVAVSHAGGEIPYLNSGLQLACWRVFVTNWTMRREQGHDEQHVSVGRSPTAPARRGFLRRARQLPQHAPELVRRHRSLGVQHLAGGHLHRYVPASDGGTAEADRRPAARRAGPRPPRPRRLRQPASRGADRSQADCPPGWLRRPRSRIHGSGDRRLPRGAVRRPGWHDGADPGTAPRSAGAARRTAGPASGAGVSSVPGAAGRAGLSRGVHRAVLPGAALPGAALPGAGRRAAPCGRELR